MTLKFTRLSNHLGVELNGLDLRESQSPSNIAALNKAFIDYSVLVIRQQSLAPQEMISAIQNFGDIFEQHNNRFQLKKFPLIHYLSNQEYHADGTRYIPGSGYHTDHSNDTIPPKATALYAIKLPEKGGDTQFVNMHAAYETLPASIKTRLKGLNARHVYQSKFSKRKLMSLSRDRDSKFSESVMHPLVRTHPESNRKALYINPIRIDAVDGMNDAEAICFLDNLLAHAIQEQHQYRHKWQLGDLVIWDNRCLMHKANDDYDHAQERYLYRIMLKGSRPI